MSFLSPEWFAALDEALTALGPTEAAPFVLGQLLTDGSGAPVASFEIALGGGVPPRLCTPASGSADVTLVTDVDSARALVSGTAGAGELLAAGRVTIRGDATRLVASMSLLEALGAGYSAVPAPAPPANEEGPGSPDGGPHATKSSHEFEVPPRPLPSASE